MNLRNDLIKTGMLSVPAFALVWLMSISLSSLYKTHPYVVVGAVVLAGFCKLVELTVWLVWEGYWRNATKVFVPNLHKLWFKD